MGACVFVCTPCYRAGLWHAILQCQRFCRVSAISHSSWKMSDPGPKHTHSDNTLQGGRKGEVELVSYTANQWPLNMTVKWFTYLTNAIMWKVCFSSIFPHTAAAKLWTGCVFAHLTRSEKQHQTVWVLVGSGLLWLSFVFPLSHANTHLKVLRYMHKYNTETHTDKHRQRQDS